MNIVIVGDGKVGNTLTAHLSKEGHDVTVIDNRPESLAQTMNLQDVFCVEGNGMSYTVQMEAGVQKADLLIAATSRDETNMLCCMVAKKLGAGNTIARVRDPEYQEQMLFLKDELGLSMTVNPEKAAALEISRMLRFSNAIDVDSFAKGRVEIVTFKVKEGTPLVGLALSELHRSIHPRVLVCMASREGEIYIPRGDFVIQAGDKLSVVAAPHDISLFFRATGMLQRRAKSVMIVGGGRIAYYLAYLLLESGMQVKIIEREEEHCHRLSELLPKAEILHGDGTDQELLHEEGLYETDAFISLTGIDEENIILSMYARTCKVEKVITKVNNDRFIDMLKGSGLEVFVSPKQEATRRILSYVRAMQNATGSSVESLSYLAGGRVEALEFRVRPGARCIGIPLKDLVIDRNALIGAIIRKGKCIVPGGNDTIEPGDSAIVVTTLPGLRDLDTILREA